MTDEISGTPETPDPLEAAHGALARARRLARDRGVRPGAPGTARSPRSRPRPSAAPASGASGTAATDRDPHLVGGEVAKLVASRGWGVELQVAGVIGRWSEIVGDQVARHVEVVAFEGTTLTVRAGSTVWATQMRLLQSSVVRRIEELVGEDVVTDLVIHGPAGPTWRRGPLSAGGRGPRDTYG